MFNPQENHFVPILMGTQHPDNAGIPFWSDQAFVPTSNETKEIYTCFKELELDEFMWDWEGKFADEAMIERLLSQHLEYFKENQVGKQKRITLRIPNIWEEKTFKLARAYMSVLSAAEFTESLGLTSPPVFELILPMTKKASQLIQTQETFRKTAKLHEEIFEKDRFGKAYIHMIPLIESMEDLTNCESLLREYLQTHEKEFGFLPSYLRTFIARSDPALNAGFVPAIVSARLALRAFYNIEKEFNIPVYPIVGTGSLPFRGGINPENIEQSLAQYEGAKTVSIQSAFRYDYPIDQVKKALAYITKTFENPKKIQFSQEEADDLNTINQHFKEFYSNTIVEMAPLINKMAKFVPSRRERVQHVGLFGYSRGIGDVSLPRAIKFTASCYSLGIPPEFVGTGRGLKWAKENGQLELLQKHFFTLESELKHAGKYINFENLNEFAETEQWAKEIQEDIKLCQEILGIKLGPQKDHHMLHRNATSNIRYKEKMGMDFQVDLIEAARLRKSLG
jgi:phosphoenolpyruvate carboxylase